MSHLLYSASSLIESYEDGNEHGWHEELLFIWNEDRERTLKLLDEIVSVGQIKEPVIIGPDRRVWDGHHRIAIGLALSIAVPVVFSK